MPKLAARAKKKRTLVLQYTARAGTDSDLNYVFFEFLASALKKLTARAKKTYIGITVYST